jgi:hypothetical protein
MSDRVYSEEEVALLIRRAVELESERTKRGGKGDQKGLTMQDLEKIAADSGIDPELMRLAADDLHQNYTSSSLDETTVVKDSDILAEHWIKANINSRVLDDLILELNHQFGTSQKEITWWNKLFDDYSGKAIVNKTATSAEWKYTDEMSLYTTRVLIQQRGEKLRIRVSKRQTMNLSWDTTATNIIILFFTAIILIPLGAAAGFAVTDNPWFGMMAGVTLTALLFPLISWTQKRRIKKHVREITEIAENLVLQARQMTSEPSTDKSTNGQSGTTETQAIELDMDKDNSDSSASKSGNRLRNNLRK